MLIDHTANRSIYKTPSVVIIVFPTLGNDGDSGFVQCGLHSHVWQSHVCTAQIGWKTESPAFHRCMLLSSIRSITTSLWSGTILLDFYDFMVVHPRQLLLDQVDHSNRFGAKGARNSASKFLFLVTGVPATLFKALQLHVRWGGMAIPGYISTLLLTLCTKNQLSSTLSIGSSQRWTCAFKPWSRFALANTNQQKEARCR